MSSTAGTGTAVVPPGYGTALLIDLDAIAANYSDLCARAEPAEVAASVKADAYGLGASQVGLALAAAGLFSLTSGSGA